MIRLLYSLSVVALIGSTGWAASGLHGDRMQSEGRVGILLLAALQR